MAFASLDQDHGFRALKQRLATDFAPIDIGVDDKPHGRISTSDLALIHEFGLGVPERSFLRAWVDENAAEIAAYTKELTTLYVVGSITRGELYDRLGRWAVQGVQQKILSNIPPPLDPATVRRKGSDLALVDSRRLLDAIMWEIGQV